MWVPQGFHAKTVEINGKISSTLKDWSGLKSLYEVNTTTMKRKQYIFVSTTFLIRKKDDIQR